MISCVASGFVDPTAPCLLVIASLSRKRELSFLRFLLHMLPQRASLFAIGRIDFLLFLTETEYTVSLVS